MNAQELIDECDELYDIQRLADENITKILNQKGGNK